MTRSRKILLAALTVALGLCLVAAIAAPLMLRSHMNEPFFAAGDEAVTIVLEPGSSAGRMLDRLETEGLIRSSRRVRLWLRWKGGAESLQAGEYRFEGPASALQILGRLRAGDVVLHGVTVPEGLFLPQIAALFGEAGLADEARLLELFRDPQPIRDLIPEATDLEGYLFPETYRLSRQVTEEEIRDAMVARFRAVVQPAIVEGAAQVGLSLRETVVLASLIEKETSVPGERPLISAVFHNRMKKGMLMQCDPTVRYALYRAGKPVGRLTYADLRIDSPWNTYVTPGLPPTPIASPGKASLQAAVQPLESPALYFVAAPDGGHTFSDDLAGHNRAVAVWRRHERAAGLR